MSQEYTQKFVPDRGRFTDEFECFSIEDFEVGDSLRVKGGKDRFVRGVVTGVSMQTNLISFKTKDGSDNNLATVEDIVSLEEYQKGWLDHDCVQCTGHCHK